MSGGQFTLRPGSGGFIELELFKPDDADAEDPPSIMLSITAPAPRAEPFALSPELARQLALGLLEQVDAYERWQAANGGGE